MRVVCAMSGGVDSSVAAAVLAEAGHEVIGATMQIWPDDQPAADGGCCSLAAVHDARRVADRLGIPYYVLNLREAFAAEVIAYFCREYAAGRTPNPCIACNQRVKFAELLSRALALEADALATGHYARVEQGADGRWLLQKARDAAKDQTYALYGLTQAQLGRALFPLGDLTKAEVRQRAAELGLAVADKAESQEICFVTGDYRDFLAARIPEAIRPGPILDTAGNVLGRHAGLPRYTVGQRSGLGVAAGVPLYVLELDANRNALIVGRREEEHARGTLLTDVNLIPWDRLDGELAVTIKLRYGARESPAKAYPAASAPGAVAGAGEKDVVVLFDRPLRAVAPGQAGVLYRGETVIGGGTIVRALGRGVPDGRGG
ncbi:MAG: tRNA 2-thiouridine(34) synthase MnmA [Bacillota bacterium]